MGNPAVPADNVVDFPTTSANSEEAAMSPEQAQAEAMKKQEFLLKQIEKNRHVGVENLSKKVDSLENVEGVCEDAGVEGRLRDLSKGLGATLTSLEAINSMLDYYRHDLFAVIQNLTKLEKAQFNSGAHLQVLLQLLSDKEIISEEQMQETWNKMIPNSVEEKPQEAEDTTEKQ